jgi:hypothetical protein
MSELQAAAQREAETARARPRRCGRKPPSWRDRSSGCASNSPAWRPRSAPWIPTSPGQPPDDDGRGLGRRLGRRGPGHPTASSRRQGGSGLGGPQGQAGHGAGSAAPSSDPAGGGTDDGQPRLDETPDALSLLAPPLVFAHAAYRPLSENSMAASRPRPSSAAGHRAGHPPLRLGELVSFHDDTTDRLCGVPARSKR